MSANLLRFSSSSLVRAFRHCCCAVSDESGAPNSCASFTSICLKSLKASWLILLRVITSHLERLRVRPIVEQVFSMNSTSAAIVSALSSRHLPPSHGIRVTPSRRFPSDLTTPTGSLVAGKPALIRPRQVMPFTRTCLAVRPCPRRHERSYYYY